MTFRSPTISGEPTMSTFSAYSSMHPTFQSDRVRPQCLAILEQRELWWVVDRLQQQLDQASAFASLQPGQTVGGFEVTETTAAPQSNVAWFAYANGGTWTGGGNFNSASNPGFEGGVGSAAPEPSTWAMMGLGFAALALLQSSARAARRRRRMVRWTFQAASSSSRALRNWTASARAEAPRPKARSTMRASPRMSRVMLKAEACPLRSARITSKPLIVA